MEHLYNINKIRGKMAEFGYTYKDIATLLNVSERTVLEKMNGRSLFSADMLYKIAQACKTTIDFFYGDAVYIK